MGGDVASVSPAEQERDGSERQEGERDIYILRFYSRHRERRDSDSFDVVSRLACAFRERRY